MDLLIRESSSGLIDRLRRESSRELIDLLESMLILESTLDERLRLLFIADSVFCCLVASSLVVSSNFLGASSSESESKEFIFIVDFTTGPSSESESRRAFLLVKEGLADSSSDDPGAIIDFSLGLVGSITPSSDEDSTDIFFRELFEVLPDFLGSSSSLSEDFLGSSTPSSSEESAATARFFPFPFDTFFLSFLILFIIFTVISLFLLTFLLFLAF